jgi:hypothetical protein
MGNINFHHQENIKLCMTNTDYFNTSMCICPHIRNATDIKAKENINKRFG